MPKRRKANDPDPESQCVVRRPRRLRPNPQRHPLPIGQNGTTEYLRALDFRPSSSDIDIQRRNDISISDERQKMKIKRHLASLDWCKVCLQGNQPVAFINFPCGHMTHCACCNPHVTRCCTCQGRIVNTVPCPVQQYNGRFFFNEWFNSRE
ncbi:hypothetical protein RRG08_021098 [Elysia crispata]|uniref:RING-type domain-containing protein n=1 Tax=Elysia crispata TaxID=231223 RepID=A0AAE1DB02_9GAST|nr:hypothetical protein RRG08_021098 [Elysia crispata]